MCSILLLPLVARCLETIDVYIWHVCFYVCCSDCVGVCGNVCCEAAKILPLGALPWVVLCCLLLGPDCSYILQGLV